MVDLTLDEIYKYLNDRELRPTLQRQNNQVFITLQVKKMEVPLFFAVLGEGTLLQMIAYVPYTMHEKAISEAARLLHYVNREIDMPGFGMDEKDRLMFYRLVLACVDKKVDERLLELYIATTRVACETFMEAIQLISSGTANFERVSKERKWQG